MTRIGTPHPPRWDPDPFRAQSRPWPVFAHSPVRQAVRPTPASSRYTAYPNFQTAIEEMAQSLAALQRQITSLAGITLQNCRAIDLLTAEKGGTCIFLQENCCYYINESQVIETSIKTYIR
ncbi:ERV-BabFcenv provirus ancestral Env polyprotein-like [Symphalangus syndactylus]|uniref:ERV-BabFcenv provirus ancestral Env polyprotein-like n=1 Tax=Symphalangus syndactylus TaxID=9590 RepID=UPI0030068FA0